jgi:2-methylisocitrate lyase-like PEP mutase family enzyme
MQNGKFFHRIKFSPARHRVSANTGLYLAAERVRAAVAANHEGDSPLVRTARAENFIRGNPDLADTIARLQTDQEAGADVLYAPGLTAIDDTVVTRALS